MQNKAYYTWHVNDAPNHLLHWNIEHSFKQEINIFLYTKGQNWKLNKIQHLWKNTLQQIFTGNTIIYTPAKTRRLFLKRLMHINASLSFQSFLSSFNSKYLDPLNLLHAWTQGRNFYKRMHRKVFIQNRHKKTNPACIKWKVKRVSFFLQLPGKINFSPRW